MSRTSSMSSHLSPIAKVATLCFAAAIALALSLASANPTFAFADEAASPVDGEQPVASQEPIEESEEGEEGAGEPGNGEGEGSTEPEPAPEPEPEPLKPGWNKDSSGIWYYGLADGSAKTGWLDLKGKRYWLDPANGGAMVTGLNTIDGKDYFFTASGALAKSCWCKSNDTWYYAGDTGELKTGWVKLKNIWYWLEPADGGAMVTGFYTVSGKDYHFKASGAMSVGWVKHEGVWYYAASSGALQKDWIDVKGKRYWLDPANGGAMVTGLNTIDGKDFFFTSSGALAKSCWCKLAGAWYYAGDTGELKTGWVKLKNIWYWLEPADGGAMATGIFQVRGEWFIAASSGAVYINEWVIVDSLRYHVDTRGEIMTGWFNEGGKTYWLEPANNGAMVTGFFTAEGGKYCANENGAVLKSQWIESEGVLLLAGVNGRIDQEAIRTSDGGIKLVGSEGEGATGLLNIGGCYLHVNPESESLTLSTGWVEVDGSKYWANNMGIMQIGWEKIDGTWYFFSTEGVMQTGWIEDGGERYYLDEDGKMLTGWLEIGEDKYYLKASGAMATGTILIGNKAYKFGEDGKFISIEKQIAAKAQNIGSSTEWLILVDTTENKVGVFNGKKGNWNLIHYWSCSSGAPWTPTVKGYFTVGNRGTNFGEEKGYTCWWWTQFCGDYLFHSVLYYPHSKTAIQDGRLGMNLSHGCIRLHIDNAKWIYDNIPRGTKVYVY